MVFCSAGTSSKMDVPGCGKSTPATSRTRRARKPRQAPATPAGPTSLYPGYSRIACNQSLPLSLGSFIIARRYTASADAIISNIEYISRKQPVKDPARERR